MALKTYVLKIEYDPKAEEVEYITEEVIEEANIEDISF